MNYPKSLYRFFKTKEHRDQFIQGSIRFGNLEVYKKIEDHRKDPDEGSPKGKYKTDKLMYINLGTGTKGFKSGDMHISGSSLNSFFIVSMLDKDADLKHLSEKFGKYAVKIKDVEKLIDLLNQNCKVPWKVGKIILEQVKYNKDKYITMEKDNPHLPVGYYHSQKSENFAEECEWRIVLTGSTKDLSISFL